MSLLSQRDFDTKSGQEKIIRTIHSLEATLHEVELVVRKLQQKEKQTEQELRGPEAY